MKPVLVIYATREGHTRNIAEHIGTTLGAHGAASEVIDAAHIPQEFSPEKYSAAILSASLHVGKYEPEMLRFVKRYLAELQRIQTVFISVSLAERTAEDPNVAEERRVQAQAEVKATIDCLLAETGWHPTHIAAVAGALLYSRYNFVTRFIMKRISKSAGGPVDTSRDYEFTDWKKLDRLVVDLLQNIPATAGASWGNIP